MADPTGKSNLHFRMADRRGIDPGAKIANI